MIYPNLQICQMAKDNLILKKTFDFAISIVHLTQKLKEEREYIISKQLLRAGTSVGANVEEAQDAISKSEFRYKMSISLREAKETRYWIRILDVANMTTQQLDSHQKEINEIINILTAIVNSSSKR